MSDIDLIENTWDFHFSIHSSNSALDNLMIAEVIYNKVNTSLIIINTAGIIVKILIGSFGCIDFD